jgi:hypothetical protein
LKRITFVCIAATVLLTGMYWDAQAQSVGSSPSSASPVGLPVETIIECGKGYVSHELYDAKITVLEIVRGAKAFDRLKETVKGTTPAENGFEYLLARVRFEYSARGLPGDCIHELKEEQFIAVSPRGDAYKVISLIPRALKGMIRAGESQEGWAGFIIPSGDNNPLMFFAVKVSGAVDHGGNVWFKLR